jgi:excisionase family DNA binding protein
MDNRFATLAKAIRTAADVLAGALETLEDFEGRQTVAESRPAPANIGVKAAAFRLGISPSNVLRLIEARHIRAAKIGRRFTIDPLSLEEFIRQRSVGPVAPRKEA